MTIRLAAASACMLLACSARAEQGSREVVYGGIGAIGCQIIPLYDKGYLVYLHYPSNRLQVFRPDTQLAYEMEAPFPTTGARVPQARRLSLRTAWSQSVTVTHPMEAFGRQASGFWIRKERASDSWKRTDTSRCRLRSTKMRICGPWDGSATRCSATTNPNRSIT
jgi:hypothetical protein